MPKEPLVVMLPRSQGAPRIRMIFIVEKEGLGEFVCRMIWEVVEGGAGADLYAQMLLIVHAAFLDGELGDLDEPEALRLYMAQILRRTASIGDPSKGNAAAIALNLASPAKRKRGRPRKKAHEQMFEHIQRAVTLSIERETDRTYLDAVLEAEERCRCDRRAIERAMAKVSKAGGITLVEAPQSTPDPEPFEELQEIFPTLSDADRPTIGILVVDELS